MSVDFAELKKTQRGRVLKLLLDLEWHPYMDLAAVGGVRYSARLLELKRMGYEVETRTVHGKGETGLDYRLKSSIPGVPQKKLVKVFLTEEQAEAILNHTQMAPWPHLQEAKRELGKALASFRTNRHKL